MINTQKITPCLWFDHQAEEAANAYISIFKNSQITHISYYGEAGQEVHRQKAGTALAVSFELEGQSFVALNAGPQFKFNEAVSFQIHCDTQQEVDHYWDRLSHGGDPAAQQCGWLKDKYGLSWQVIPNVLFEMLDDPDAEKSGRAMTAMMQMKKLDISQLQQAYNG